LSEHIHFDLRPSEETIEALERLAEMSESALAAIRGLGMTGPEVEGLMQAAETMAEAATSAAANTAEIVAAMAEDCLIRTDTAEAALEFLAEYVRENVANGREVKIRGLGTFRRALHAPQRHAANLPHCGGRKKYIPARYRPKFKPAPAFIAAVGAETPPEAGEDAAEEGEDEEEPDT